MMIKNFKLMESSTELFVVKEIFVTMTLPQLREVEMTNVAMMNQDVSKPAQLLPPSLQQQPHLDHPQVVG